MYDVFIEKHNIKTFGLFPHLIDVNTGNPIGGKFCTLCVHCMLSICD